MALEYYARHVNARNTTPRDSVAPRGHPSWFLNGGRFVTTLSDVLFFFNAESHGNVASVELTNTPIPPWQKTFQ